MHFFFLLNLNYLYTHHYYYYGFIGLVHGDLDVCNALLVHYSDILISFYYLLMM